MRAQNLFAGLSLLAFTAGAQAQTAPQYTGSSCAGVTGCRQATAADIIKTLNGAAQAVDGQLTLPAIYGSGSTAAMVFGTQGLPYTYSPNAVILTNSPLQIDVAHPLASGRGLSVGAAVQIGNGAVFNNVSNGAPPIAPAADVWNNNPAPASVYTSMDSVGLLVANGSEPNIQVVSGVSVTAAAPNTVIAPANTSFAALTCTQGEIVQLNTTPLLVGAVTGCPNPWTLNVLGWEQWTGVPGATNPITAPLQNPTTYQQGSPLTLTAMVPTHVFGQNILVGLGGTSAATDATGTEYDMICGSTSCNGDGIDVFTNGGQFTGAGLNVSGSSTGGFAIGLEITFAHYTGIHIDLTAETEATAAPTEILLDKQYAQYVVARNGSTTVWGEDAQGNTVHGCPTGVTAGCGAGTFAGPLAASGLAITSPFNPLAGPPYPLSVANTYNGTTTYPLLLDTLGDMHITGALATNGIIYAPQLQTGVSTVEGLGVCGPANEGTFRGVNDASSPTPYATLSGGGSTHAPAYCNGTAWVGA